MAFKIHMGGKKLSLSNISKSDKKKIIDRLVEKEPLLKTAILGNCPGLKINGEDINRSNIHKFEASNQPKEALKAPEPVAEGEFIVPETIENSLDALKEHMKNTMTLKELKAEAKKLNIKVPFNAKEAKIIDLLVEAGYR